MERIVYGIAHINFYTNLSEPANGNSAPNIVQKHSSKMSVSQIPISASENQESANYYDQEIDNLKSENVDGNINQTRWAEVDLRETGQTSSYASAGEAQITSLPSTSAGQEIVNVCSQETFNESPNMLIRESSEEATAESGWEEVDDLEEGGKNKKGFTLAERRQMPSRASKETSLLRIKRRTIMKPAKHVKTYEDFKNLKPSEIKKIYLNKKLVNFKPSSLETIFEEATTAESSTENLCQIMGSRKIKRSLTLSDGFRYSKKLVNKRRAKIKKTIGKRFALKKIPLEEFITKLNTSIEKDEHDSNIDCCMNDQRDEMAEETPSTSFVSNTGKTFDETTSFSTSNLFCSPDNTMSH